MPALRHYFNVSNTYVLSKLRLLLFPWRHSVSILGERRLQLEKERETNSELYC